MIFDPPPIQTVSLGGDPYGISSGRQQMRSRKAKFTKMFCGRATYAS